MFSHNVKSHLKHICKVAPLPIWFRPGATWYMDGLLRINQQTRLIEVAIEDGQSICSQYTISHGSAAKGLRVHMGKQASLHKVMAYV